MPFSNGSKALIKNEYQFKFSKNSGKILEDKLQKETRNLS